jgi:hypothetical protein
MKKELFIFLFFSLSSSIFSMQSHLSSRTKEEMIFIDPIHLMVRLSNENFADFVFTTKFYCAFDQSITPTKFQEIVENKLKEYTFKRPYHPHIDKNKLINIILKRE